jgi:tRNA (guanine37-N1)-methyltransferase
MTLHFFTLFPELIFPYFQTSIMGRGIKRGLFEVEVVDFRQFAENKWGKVDTPIAGGGAGMVLDNRALRSALLHYRSLYPSARILFLTPVGKPFTQSDAVRLSRESHLFLVAGRYEGFDERLIEDLAEELFSVGEFIVSGGELPALMVADAILRNVPGVLGNSQSLEGESFSRSNRTIPLLEAPNFSKMGEIPPILKTGHHLKIAKWREKLAVCKTLFHAPKMVESLPFSYLRELGVGGEGAEMRNGKKG